MSEFFPVVPLEGLQATSCDFHSNGHYTATEQRREVATSNLS